MCNKTELAQVKCHEAQIIAEINRMKMRVKMSSNEATIEAAKHSLIKLNSVLTECKSDITALELELQTPVH